VTTSERAYPAKPRPGDRVAVLSPSAGLAQIFPDLHEQSMRRLCDELELVPVDPRSLGTEPFVRTAAGGWTWHQPNGLIEGPTWGGNLEILGSLLMADRAIPTPDAIDGHVLILETSEEMPPATEVFRTLRNIGERGLLGRFPALLMGRAKSWDRTNKTTLEQRAAYAASQREAVLKATAAYNPSATIVFDVDFGHTDPQLIIPYGGLARIDGRRRTISVKY